MTALVVAVSVLRHFGIDALGPGIDGARQVGHLGEAGLTQEVHGFGATSGCNGRRSRGWRRAR